MEKYTKVVKQKEDTEIEEKEIRITTQGKPRNFISYATSLFKEKGATEVVLKAMGRAISKTVTIAEIIKRRIPGLHQITVIDSTDIVDVWEPKEEGLDRLETVRHVSSITITLSTLPLDTSAPGYQAPLPADQVKELDFVPTKKLGGEGRVGRINTGGAGGPRRGNNQGVQLGGGNSRNAATVNIGNNANVGGAGNFNQRGIINRGGGSQRQGGGYGGGRGNRGITGGIQQLDNRPILRHRGPKIGGVVPQTGGGQIDQGFGPRGRGNFRQGGGIQGAIRQGGGARGRGNFSSDQGDNGARGRGNFTNDQGDNGARGRGNFINDQSDNGARGRGNFTNDQSDNGARGRGNFTNDQGDNEGGAIGVGGAGQQIQGGGRTGGRIGGGRGGIVGGRGYQGGGRRQVGAQGGPHFQGQMQGQFQGGVRRGGRFIGGGIGQQGRYQGGGPQGSGGRRRYPGSGRGRGRGNNNELDGENEDVGNEADGDLGEVDGEEF